VPLVQSKGQRWYPTPNQLKPEHLERTIRQMLQQHYDLQDQLDATREQLARPQLQPTNKTTGSNGNGPADTKLLGLHVEPVDTNSMANGATLKFNKARGTFSFQ
jgi:hypothetical protein